MENINNLGTISKEVLTILSYCDEDIINKVPNSLIKELVNYAGDSKVECFLLPEKKLEEQNISKEAKDLISLIYYSYIANQEEKREIEKIWYKNENKYQEVNIKIIDCYEVGEFNLNLQEILHKHDKILNTSGEKEICDVFEGYA